MQFKDYLEKTKEVGEVVRVFQILVHVNGLPSAKANEVVYFESGQMGQVLSLQEEFVEVLLLSNEFVEVGTKVARADFQLAVPVGDYLLGSHVDALGKEVERLGGEVPKKTKEVYRPIEVAPPTIAFRKNINKPFVTGVILADLIVSLGKGQRELVVGDRKSGRTQFLLTCLKSAVEEGMVCIYAAVAKKRTDIAMVSEYLVENDLTQNSIIVASSSSDPASLVYITPYTAMTVAEYFRDRGRDVLVIFDSLTAHAKYYREITLLAKRFPGRSSYPGDIFFIHARLLERAGNFLLTTKSASGKLERREVAITALPVAELVMGDLSGYIQTNLMSMTDGHMYFDIDLYNEGRRPAINPFLSVTRVGRQAQTPLVQDVSRILTRFLVKVRQLEQFMHFGAELADTSRQELALGEKFKELFNQPQETVVPINVSVILTALLWSGIVKDKQGAELRPIISVLVEKYKTDSKFQSSIDVIITSAKDFPDLVTKVREQESLFAIS